MLHSYVFKNFQSFRHRTEVSLVLNKKAPKSGWERTSLSGARLSTALATLGANAAGKTALLQPLAYVRWFVLHSFNRDPGSAIGLNTHRSAPDEPFEFEMVAEDMDGVVWRYELKATQQRVLHEALYKKQTRFAYVFVREWDEANERYKIKQQDFGFAPAEAAKVRPNASLISTATQYGVDTAKYRRLFGSFTTNLNYMGRVPPQGARADEAAKMFAELPYLRDQMVELLKRWDLGLHDIELRPVETSDQKDSPEKLWTWLGVHVNSEGSKFTLPKEYESSGTQSAFVLLSTLLLALSSGIPALVDEMESDLHPMLLIPILELFADPSTNPHGAQLIFTCHSMSVLDVLQKSQVMFVEKNNCESEAYRGDSIAGLRSDDNLRAKYETGALGAVPRT